MAQKTIPQLTEATTLNPNAVFPFDSGTQTYKVKAEVMANELLGLAGTDRFVSKWVSGKSYGAGDVVSYNGVLYVSRVAGNTEAPTVAANWKLAQGSGLNPQFNPALATRALGLFSQIPNLGENAAGSGLAYSHTLKRFVACFTSNLTTAANTLAYSNDKGASWTFVAAPSSAFVNDVIWVDEFGLFIAVGNNVIYTSPDGIAWTTRTVPLSCTLFRVAYSRERGQLLAVGENGAPVAIQSTNGTTWSQVTLATSTSGYTANTAVYSPSLALWIVAGTDAGGTAGFINSSANGTAWTARTMPVGAKPTSGIWAEELKQFFIVGDFGSIGTVQLISSYDGINWTGKAIPSVGANKRQQDIAWAPELGALIVGNTSFGGDTDLVQFSFDEGATWIASANSFSSAASRIYWFPQIAEARFVAKSTGNFGGKSRYVGPVIAPMV